MDFNQLIIKQTFSTIELKWRPWFYFYIKYLQKDLCLLDNKTCVCWYISVLIVCQHSHVSVWFHFKPSFHYIFILNENKTRSAPQVLHPAESQRVKERIKWQKCLLWYSYSHNAVCLSAGCGVFMEITHKETNQRQMFSVCWWFLYWQKHSVVSTIKSEC